VTDQGVDRLDTAHPIADAAGQDDRCPGHDDLRTQLFRLPTRGMGKISAPDPPGEPELKTFV
jgi:hypothetical protein